MNENSSREGSVRITLHACSPEPLLEQVLQHCLRVLREVLKFNSGIKLSSQLLEMIKNPKTLFLRIRA